MVENNNIINTGNWGHNSINYRALTQHLRKNYL